MTVDGIPAGVADAIDEPATVDAGRRVEDPLGLLDPVDRLRSLAPESLRIAQAAGVDLVITAGSGVHDAFFLWIGF
jgi:hypothetical protein